MCMLPARGTPTRGGRAATVYEGDLPPAPGVRTTTETDWGGAPSVLRVILGRRLERPRIRAGLGYAEAGAALGPGRSTIRRMEAAEVARLRLADAEKPLQVHGMTGPHQIVTFPRSVREANKRGWWHGHRDVMPDRCAAYLSLERAADRIRGCRNSCVPGLSQTEDYARALLRATHPGASAEAIERRVALRTRRQRLLAGARPPRVWAVVDETVHLGKPEHVEPYREALGRLATRAPPATRTGSLLGAIRAESQGRGGRLTAVGDRCAPDRRLERTARAYLSARRTGRGGSGPGSRASTGTGRPESEGCEAT